MFNKNELIKMFNDGYIINNNFGEIITDLYPLNRVEVSFAQEKWVSALDYIWKIYALDGVSKEVFIDKFKSEKPDIILLGLSQRVLHSHAKVHKSNPYFSKTSFVDEQLKELTKDVLKGYKKGFSELTTEYGPKDIFEKKIVDAMGISINKEFMVHMVENLEEFEFGEKGILYVGPKTEKASAVITEKIQKVFRSKYSLEISAMINLSIPLVRRIHNSIIQILKLHKLVYALNANLAKDFMNQSSLDKESLKQTFHNFSQK